LEEAGWSFEMEISFIEIYCEQIKDLLASGEDSGSPDSNGSSGGGGGGGVGISSSSSSTSSKTKHKIIQNEFGQNIVTNVEMVPVDPADKGSIAELMQHAASLRRLV
jgi:hypothetical protein